jgi:hypothetical protein
MTEELSIPDAFNQSIEAKDKLIFEPLIHDVLVRVDKASKNGELYCVIENTNNTNRSFNKRDAKRSPYLKAVLFKIEKTISISFNYDDGDRYDHILAEWDRK